VLEHLTETWRGITDVRFRIQGRETRPQMLQVTGLNEGVILLAFDIAISDVRGMLSISIPASAIETMEEKVAEGWNRTRRQASAAEAAWLQVNLGRVPLNVKTQLETRMTAREVLALQPGDIVAMPQSVQSPVEIHIGGVPRFTGRLAREHHGKAAVTVEQQIGTGAGMV
jgi:flagellar motor switch protein FliM